MFSYLLAGCLLAAAVADTSTHGGGTTDRRSAAGRRDSRRRTELSSSRDGKAVRTTGFFLRGDGSGRYNSGQYVYEEDDEASDLSGWVIRHNIEYDPATDPQLNGPHIIGQEKYGGIGPTSAKLDPIGTTRADRRDSFDSYQNAQYDTVEDAEYNRYPGSRYEEAVVQNPYQRYGPAYNYGDLTIYGPSLVPVAAGSNYDGIYSKSNDAGYSGPYRLDHSDPSGPDRKGQSKVINTFANPGEDPLVGFLTKSLEPIKRLQSDIPVSDVGPQSKPDDKYKTSQSKKYLPPSSHSSSFRKEIADLDESFRPAHHPLDKSGDGVTRGPTEKPGKGHENVGNVQKPDLFAVGHPDVHADDSPAPVPLPIQRDPIQRPDAQADIVSDDQFDSYAFYSDVKNLYSTDPPPPNFKPHAGNGRGDIKQTIDTTVGFREDKFQGSRGLRAGGGVSEKPGGHQDNVDSGLKPERFAAGGPEVPADGNSPRAPPPTRRDPIQLSEPLPDTPFDDQFDSYAFYSDLKNLYSTDPPPLNFRQQADRDRGESKQTIDIAVVFRGDKSQGSTGLSAGVRSEKPGSSHDSERGVQRPDRFAASGPNVHADGIRPSPPVPARRDPIKLPDPQPDIASEDDQFDSYAFYSDLKNLYSTDPPPLNFRPHADSNRDDIRQTIDTADKFSGDKFAGNRGLKPGGGSSDPVSVTDGVSSAVLKADFNPRRPDRSHAPADNRFPPRAFQRPNFNKPPVIRPFQSRNRPVQQTFVVSRRPVKSSSDRRRPRPSPSAKFSPRPSFDSSRGQRPLQPRRRPIQDTKRPFRPRSKPTEDSKRPGKQFSDSSDDDDFDSYAFYSNLKNLYAEVK